MSKGSKTKTKKKTKKKKESKEPKLEDTKALLGNVPGIGPKTAEKLIAAGYDDLQKIEKANNEKLAAAIAGLSPNKAETIINETKDLLKAVKEGKATLRTKAKSRRRKAPEPEPDVHELPEAAEISKAEARTNLVTGYEEDNVAQGIPVGPKWLTKFERARIVGARALQVSMGAPELIDRKGAPKGRFAFAEAELKLGVLPMTVRRTLPSGESFDIPLDRLLKNTRLD